MSELFRVISCITCCVKGGGVGYDVRNRTTTMKELIQFHSVIRKTRMIYDI